MSTAADKALFDKWGYDMGLVIMEGETMEEYRERYTQRFLTPVEEPKPEVLDITRDFIKGRL